MLAAVCDQPWFDVGYWVNRTLPETVGMSAYDPKRH